MSRRTRRRGRRRRRVRNRLHARRRRRGQRRRARRMRYQSNFTYRGTRPVLQGFWRAPLFIGTAHPVRRPQAVVVPYIAPSAVVINRAPVAHTASAPLPETKQLVAQQFTRIKFYNRDMLGFTLEGALVTDVVPGGPADDGGLEEGFMAFALNDVQCKPGTLLEAMDSAVKPYVVDFGFVPGTWEARWSDASAQFYFANHETKTTSWDLPPIPMAKTAVADAESQPTGRGDQGVFTVICIVSYFNNELQQDPIVNDVKAPGTISIKVPKTMTVEGFVQLVEDVQAGSMGHLDYLIDYTSAYTENAKLDDNALLNSVVTEGQKVEVCGHKIAREVQTFQCCTFV